MKSTLASMLGVLLLTSIGTGTQAQPAPPSAAPHTLDREQQSALDKQDQEIARIASGIVKMVDTGNAGEVWDGASPVAKHVISRADFVRKITHDRAQLGPPRMRMPSGVQHYRYDGSGNLPAGAYISALFETQFGQTDRTSRETVTFFLDADNVWRFAGYSVR